MSTLLSQDCLQYLLTVPKCFMEEKWHAYCKLGNFHEGFSFVKIKSSQNDEITDEVNHAQVVNIKRRKYVF